jgi:L-ascorbate metabolism protein UlaG (beta-lactamase superfamily)
MELTWIGTATVLMRHAGFTVLTDPNFLDQGQRAYLGKGLWSKRLTSPALWFADLPPLDAIVLSHLHGDHFDRVAAGLIDIDQPVLTTRQAARTLRLKGFLNAIAVDTWETYPLVKDGQVLNVSAVPGRHAPSAVQALFPDVMGSVLQFPDGLSVYITGDTLVIDDLREVQVLHPDLDLGLWHLGGTRILGLRVTMDGHDGADLLEMVRPRVCIPIHYGDYGVFVDPVETFLDEVERRGLQGVRTVGRGETVSLHGGRALQDHRR